MVREGHRAASLQGNLSQSRRQAALDGFRDGSFQILVATDIAARGIDVSTISHVINYDMPDTVEAYTHRIGRTGRATRAGDAFTLVTRDDEPLVRAVERTLGASIVRHTVAGFDYAAPAPRVRRGIREAAQAASASCRREAGRRCSEGRKRLSESSRRAGGGSAGRANGVSPLPPPPPSLISPPSTRSREALAGARARSPRCPGPHPRFGEVRWPFAPSLRAGGPPCPCAFAAEPFPFLACRWSASSSFPCTSS